MSEFAKVVGENMDKLSSCFYTFLKRSVTVALIALLVTSVALLIFSFVTVFAPDLIFMQLNIAVLMAFGVVACLTAMFLKIKTQYKILLILSVAFIIRLVWIINIKSVPVSDFSTIYNAAKYFLAGDRAALRGYGYLARFPHLVPMMLYEAGMIKVFGTYHIFAIKCVSLILSVANVYLIYVLSSYYVKRKKTQLIAMIIAAIYPSFISYSSTFCTETVAVSLFLLSVILFHKANSEKTKRYTWFLLCGAMLYFSNMFRAVGIIFLIAFGLYNLIFSKKNKIASIASIFAGYLIVAAGINAILVSADVIERPLWKGAEPSAATLMLKGSNFEHLGRWNTEDAKFVSEHLEDENLSKECFRVIKERLREKTPIEIAMFYVSKFFAQWSVSDCSGTFWATAGTDIPHGSVAPISFQLIYVVVLFFSVFVFLSLKDDSPVALMLILLCGFGVLFMILEMQGRYAYIVNWIFIILAVTGIENIMGENENKYAIRVRKLAQTSKGYLKKYLFRGRS